MNEYVVTFHPQGELEITVKATDVESALKYAVAKAKKDYVPKLKNFYIAKEDL